MQIQATTAGLTAKVSPISHDSWLWKGGLYNAHGLERVLSYTHNPRMDQAVVSVDGMPDSAFTKRLAFLLWYQAAAHDPEAKRYYLATQTEMVRPALDHFGKEYAHWRPFSIRPQPEPGQLDALVQELEGLGFKAKAGIEMSMGAVLGVAITADKDVEEIDRTVEAVVAAVERR